MPKETFQNLSVEKKAYIEQILLENFYNRHVSQVKVSEIVEAMQMSRGAFYKYFQNLEDAYTYLIHKCSISVHNAILSSIQQHAQDFFLGIEQFLIHCSELDRNSDYWKKLQLLTQNNEIQAMKRTQMSPNSPMVKQWLTLLSANHFVMNSLEEALSFLYFIMALVMNALTDCVVNNWSTEELVIDFRFRKDWLLQGVTK